MSEEKIKCGITNIYFKESYADESEYKLLAKHGLMLIEPVISNEHFFVPSANGSVEFEIDFKDKNLKKHKQVKSKRLKKKYWKRTIFYQFSREKRW